MNRLQKKTGKKKYLTVIRWPSSGFPAISWRAYSAISDASIA